MSARRPWRAMLAATLVAAALSNMTSTAGAAGLPEPLAFQGVDPSPVATQTPAARPEAAKVFGLNADLAALSEADLRATAARLAEAGVAAVRVPVTWAETEPRRGDFDWSVPDRVARALDDAGILWVASMHASPAWARRDPPPPAGLWVCDRPEATDPRSASEAPPTELADAARFAGALAERYRDRLWAIEIWPEANALPRWRATGPSPEAYADLLRAVSTEVRLRSPGTLVVSGAPAPTAELGVCYLSDVVFLDRVAIAGGLAVVDAVGVSAMGLRLGPHEAPSKVEPLGFRRVEEIAARLRRRGVERPLWAMAWGWRVAGADAEITPWGGHPPQTVARWTREAYQAARSDWPWMGAMFLWHLQPDVPEGDPRWGFALWGPDGTPSAHWPVVLELAARTDGHGDVTEGMGRRGRRGLPAAWIAMGLGTVLVALAAFAARSTVRAALRSILGQLQMVGPPVAAILFLLAVLATASSLAIPSLIGVVALTLLGAARPHVAVAAVAASTPFWARVTLHAASVPIRPVELLIAVAAASACLRLVAEGRPPRASIRLHWLDFVPVALVAWAALTPLWAENRHPAVYEWRTVVAGPVAFYLILRLADQRAMAKAALDGLVLGGAAAAVWALVALAAALWGADGGAVAAEGVLRANGPYASPNNLALLLGRLLPLTAAVALWGRGTRRPAYAVALLPMLLALFTTFSRGALLVGLPISVSYLAIAGPADAPRRLARAVAAATVTVLGLAVLLLPFAGTQRMRTLLDVRPGSTLFIRMRLWESAVEMVRDHPLLGVGLDNFLYLYSERYVLRDAVQERFLSHPHNAVLDWWLRLGLPGLVAFASLVVGNLQAGRQALRTAARADRALAVGALGMQVYAVTHGMVDNVFFLVDLAIVWWIAQAALLAFARTPEEARQEPADAG